MDTLYGSVTIRPAEAGEVRGLLEESTTLLASLYPPEANHLVSGEDLTGPDALLLGAFLGELPIGMVGIRLLTEEGYAEIKRLFVSDIHRGAGIATALMAEIENHAVEKNFTLIRLETGVNQPESVSLYSRLGYSRRTAFGRYVEDDYSIFMERELT
jgi:putative acetyltransferase